MTVAQKQRERLMQFATYLLREEKSAGTVENYTRHVFTLFQYLRGAELTKEKLLEWKRHFINMGYRPSSVNSMIVSVNAYLSWCGLSHLRLKTLKLQQCVFREKKHQLTKEEYLRLICTAYEKGNRRIALIMETLCSTGIRVSELKYITVEAIHAGAVTVSLKGKVRTIVIPPKMCQKLLDYVEAKKIAFGKLFVTESGKDISRKYIWNTMKGLSLQAQVNPEKVYPHNLRHLFAVTYYENNSDLVSLANVLGHSNIETTRIYLAAPFEESALKIEKLGLVL